MRETLRRVVQGDLASLRVVIGLAVIWAIFQFENDRFLSAQNLTNLMLQITAIGLISVGIVYVLLLGEIDLSVGAVSGLAAAVGAVLNVQHGWSPYLALGAAWLVHRTAGAVVAPLTLLRVAGSIAAVIVIAHQLPSPGKMMTLVYAACLPVLYIAFLLITRELGREDLDLARAVLRRR